jgi:hypothetical protein
MSFFGDTPAELLYAMPAVGGAVTLGTATATVTGSAAGGPMLGGGGAGGTFPPCEIPHGYFSKQGKAIMWHASGVYAVPATTVANIRIALYLNNVPGATSGTSTLLCQTGIFASAATTTGFTGQWQMQGFATCTAVGTSGTLQPFGLVHWGPAQLTTTTGIPDYTMGTGTTTPVTFNTYQTTPVYLEPLAWWSASTSTPTLTMTQYFVWGLN